MADWKMSDTEIQIVSKAGIRGCIYPVIGVIGLVMVVLSALVTAGSLLEGGFSFGSLIGGFIIVMGLIFMMAGFSANRMNFHSVCSINRNSEELIFYKTEKERPYRLGFGDLSHLLLIKVIKHSSSSGGSGGRSYPTYQVFLVKKDGAVFWLDTFLKKEEFRRRAEELALFTGFAVVDRTDSELSRSASRDYDKSVVGEWREHSPFVRMHDTAGRTEIVLTNKKSIGRGFILFLVFLLFVGTPLGLAVQFVTRAAESPTIPAIAIAVFGIVFALGFLSVVLLVLLLQLRDYMLIVDRLRLTVHLRFTLRAIDRRLGRTISLPHTAIRQIRVNRLDEGHFWLSLNAKPDTVPEEKGAASLLHKFFFNIGIFQKTGIRELESGERIIGLWEIPGWIGEGQGADYRDLHFLEQRLEEILQLEEETIESS